MNVKRGGMCTFLKVHTHLCINKKIAGMLVRLLLQFFVLMQHLVVFSPMCRFGDGPRDALDDMAHPTFLLELLKNSAAFKI